MAKNGSNELIARMDRRIISTNGDAPSEGVSREAIAQRAYELYLARGGADGSEQEDCLQAEHELQH